MKEKQMKNNKGITLVALVVTIIILIILAGISINMLVGTDGLITKAKQAKENIELAEIEEQTRLNELYSQLDNSIVGTGSSFTEQTTGTATSDKILKDYTAFVNGQLVTGTMNNYSSNPEKITLTAEQKEETTINIADGYHTEIKVDATAVYEKGRIDGIQEQINLFDSGNYKRPNNRPDNVRVTSWTADKDYPILIVTTCNPNYIDNTSTKPYAYLNGSQLTTLIGNIWSEHCNVWAFSVSNIKQGDIITVPSNCYLDIKTPNSYI